jgi:SAM-dependent methyltransferase
MFLNTAQYYDKIYSFKDYKRESLTITSLIMKHAPQAKTLLDVGCGTGKHLKYFKTRFTCAGVDILPQFVKIARKHNPELRIYQRDMIRLDLPGSYDAITCLFGSIGHVRTIANLNRTIASMARLLAPGEVLVVEPWFTPKRWHGDSVYGLFVDEPRLKISRVNTSKTMGRQSVMEMHYLVSTPDRTRHYVEVHRLGLFTEVEMKLAFTKAGLGLRYDPVGLNGRGLYVGKKGQNTGRSE